MYHWKKGEARHFDKRKHPQSRQYVFWNIFLSWMKSYDEDGSNGTVIQRKGIFCPHIIHPALWCSEITQVITIIFWKKTINYQFQNQNINPNYQFLTDYILNNNPLLCGRVGCQITIFMTWLILVGRVGFRFFRSVFLCVF